MNILPFLSNLAPVSLICLFEMIDNDKKIYKNLFIISTSLILIGLIAIILENI